MWTSAEESSYITTAKLSWRRRCDRALTFLLVLYLFFVSQILMTTSMKTMLRLLLRIGSFRGDRDADDIDVLSTSPVTTATAAGLSVTAENTT